MILFEEALKIVMEQQVAPVFENVSLTASLGRVLAADVRSDIDMPPFEKSAVDGFACRLADFDKMTKLSQTAGNYLPDSIDTLEMVETIPAGKSPEKSTGPGQCAKIMTGAMVPDGADCVVMVEDTSEQPGMRIAFTKDRTAKNICHRGEDVRKGEVVLARGLQVGPAHIAVLASVGAVNPLVYKLPAVGIISTGDELVEPQETPGPAQIRNSNAWQLEAQVLRVPAHPVYYGIAGDESQSLRNLIERALAGSDLVLLTGGVSMGDFDFVPVVMQEAGIEILFKSVAIQPGKPTVFGRIGKKYIFGLPGNPVSSFMLFELMVKPFLMKMTGHEMVAREFILPMGSNYSRRRSDRKSMIPVRIINGRIFPVDYHGSAHINAYTQADAVMIMEIGTTKINQGELVHVRPI
jgi:molybdopterin molybdotransferase